MMDGVSGQFVSTRMAACIGPPGGDLRGDTASVDRRGQVMQLSARVKDRGSVGRRTRASAGPMRGVSVSPNSHPRRCMSS
jgi:hypothetical protein